MEQFIMCLEIRQISDERQLIIIYKIETNIDWPFYYIESYATGSEVINFPLQNQWTTYI